MPPALRFENGTLYIDNSPLVTGALQETYLTADSASGSGTITVRNITGFAINQILLIEELGAENAEIVKTHTATVPSGTTVTLVANTTRSHSTGAKVYVIKYDQINLSHADTATGSKTNLTTTLGSGLVAIQADTKVQAYKETEYTSGYYFARYKDSIGATFSDYSDALIYTGWAHNTAGYMIHRALKRLGLSLNDKITREFCYDDGINEALRLVKGKQLRNPKHATFNSIIGFTSAGEYETALPSAIYEGSTNKSTLAVRIGTGERLSYQDPVDFEENFSTVAVTEVRTQGTVGAATLEIDNSYDFEDSGTVNVYVSGTRYSITYTGVTRSSTAGVLTGIPASGTGAIAVTVPVDTKVYQNEISGEPRAFTIRNNQLEVYPIPDGTYDNFNIYLDYDALPDTVNTDGDTIDLDRFDMILDYLTWKIKMLARNDGNLDMNDGYYQAFKEKLNDAIRTSRTLRYRTGPNVNKVMWRGDFFGTNPYKTTDG